MKIIEKAIWAELKYKVLLTAVMINDGYSEEEVLKHILEITEYMETTQP